MDKRTLQQLREEHEAALITYDRAHHAWMSGSIFDADNEKVKTVLAEAREEYERARTAYWKALKQVKTMIEGAR
jgi:outer membrane protein TolC